MHSLFAMVLTKDHLHISITAYMQDIKKKSQCQNFSYVQDSCDPLLMFVKMKW